MADALAHPLLVATIAVSGDAMPLIADDPTRQSDILFCGPQPLTEADRERLFAEELVAG